MAPVISPKAHNVCVCDQPCNLNVFVFQCCWLGWIALVCAGQHEYRMSSLQGNFWPSFLSSSWASYKSARVGTICLCMCVCAHVIYYWLFMKVCAKYQSVHVCVCLCAHVFVRAVLVLVCMFVEVCMHDSLSSWAHCFISSSCVKSPEKLKAQHFTSLSHCLSRTHWVGTSNKE